MFYRQMCHLLCVLTANITWTLEVFRTRICYASKRFCDILLDRDSWTKIIFNDWAFITHSNGLKTFKSMKTFLNLLTKLQTFFTVLRCEFAFGQGSPQEVICILINYACLFFAICSSIHDHTDSHCFMKLLQGQLKETLFEWPENNSHGDMVQKSQRILQENKCAYINGEEQDCWFFCFVV